MSYHKQHHLQDADVPRLEAFFIPLKKMCIKSSFIKGGTGGFSVTGEEIPLNPPLIKGEERPSRHDVLLLLPNYFMNLHKR